VETALTWARGPLFWTAFTFMILGLLRHVVVTVLDTLRVMQRAGDKNVPYRLIWRTTLAWLFPVTRLQHRLVYSLSTFAFHFAIIIVPVFLSAHIVLWKRALGVSWPALPNAVADILAIVAVVTAVGIVVQRIAFADARSLSRFQDYLLPLVIALPFASGFLAMHPSWNPFRYETMLLVHVMSANLILFLVPLTKISHCVLLPFTQMLSEAAWHFPADSGSKVAVALGKESEPV
jgi:nitrate reductase gamma subunit